MKFLPVEIHGDKEYAPLVVLSLNRMARAQGCRLCQRHRERDDNCRPDTCTSDARDDKEEVIFLSPERAARARVTGELK